MGEQIISRTFSREDRHRYRDKVQRCLDAFTEMLANNMFSFQQQHMGFEIELNLIDNSLQPTMANTVVLEKINNPCFTTEMSKHNLEINVPPRPLAGDEIVGLDDELTTCLAETNDKAKDAGASLAMIGILPTLKPQHFSAQWLTEQQRYLLLAKEISTARGEDFRLNIEGSRSNGFAGERLDLHVDSILPEAACTSLQLHLQISPDDFAAHWNAAQCLAGIQVAIGANSPFLLGKALWHETRIPLFLQAVDTRPEELKNQNVRPRVWFGERWITSIFDLFEENARYFPSLFPETSEEDPFSVLNKGNTPSLSELRLHNGTIWRWNRPIYDIVDGVPHLRLENRVLPAGPTVADMMANALFFYGAQRALTMQERPLWSQMSFHAAEENLYAGARDGMDARLYWPGIGWIAPDELILRTLLPLAREGLRECGVAAAASDYYLEIIKERCLVRQTGASWQRDTVKSLELNGISRESALLTMFERYLTLMHAGTPVHTWPLA